MSEVPELDPYHFYEERWTDYDDLQENFEWEIPDHFNIADYICDRWAESRGDHVAIYAENEDGRTREVTFDQLRRHSNALANHLDNDIDVGDRVAVNLSQKPETVIAHLAIWKVGAISVPLSVLYGPDALSYRMNDAGVVGAVADATNIGAFREAAAKLRDLQTLLTVDVTNRRTDEEDLWDVVESGDDEFENAATRSDQEAILLYTSGTTGKPKGVVHLHRVLLGFLPTIITTMGNMEIREKDVFWSPADWAWIAGLFIVVFPPMFYGLPTVAVESQRFDARQAIETIDRYDVSVCYLPPSALRQMMNVQKTPGNSVRVVGSGSESVSDHIKEWVDETFEGAIVNEWYGQTEVGPVATECEALMESREGRVGRASVGVTANIVDPDSGEPLEETDQVGEIAVEYDRSLPVCFSRYWNKPKKTAEKVQDGWLLCEDLGEVDADGYFAFHGRKDHVIICSGYRIGPSEVEDSLAKHDAVVDVGVVGVPDDIRGEVPKGFIVLAEDYEPGPEIVSDLQEYVKDRLAKYQYPREIEFVEELPRTATGKIRRHELVEDENS